MSVIHSLSVDLTENDDTQLSLGSGSTLASASSREVGTVGQVINEQLGTGITDHLVSVAWTSAGVQSIVIIADADCTLETNSGGSPADTIALIANRPFIWRRGDGYYAYPFAGNVTSLYLTTSAAVRVRGKILT